MTTYEQAKKDHAYLWKIGPADDMTGAYVDQDDLTKLLANPTKATARRCFENQIEYWFQKGPDTYSRDGEGHCDAQYWIDNDPKVAAIAERYT